MRRTDLGSSINRNLKKKTESTKNQQRINKKLKQKKEAV